MVATPIGNLGDITGRAVAILAGADVVACEDTRKTRALLVAHGITARTLAYHEHNADKARPGLIARLARGEAVALVSDAGTPLVSDPGYKLVRAAIEAGLRVIPVPGPSAALAALVASGLPSDRFMFIGFLPARGAARRRALDQIKEIAATLILYESARRLPSALADMARVLGPREAAVARELTKLHEEVRHGTLAALAAHYHGAGAPKGEVAVVIAPPAPGAGAAITEADLDARLKAALETGTVRDAAALVSAATGVARKRVYARALALAGRRSPGP